VTAPAENIPEPCVILAKPVHIGDQQLGTDSLDLVAHIHSNQSSVFDPLRTSYPRAPSAFTAQRLYGQMMSSRSTSSTSSW
jgi:hypothetical protein